MGYISVVIVRDLSRLGRDYVSVGHYTDNYFPEHNVRSVSYTHLDVYKRQVLGCNLARNLFHAGKDVTLLARGNWAEEIRKNGLRIKDCLLYTSRCV